MLKRLRTVYQYYQRELFLISLLLFHAIGYSLINWLSGEKEAYILFLPFENKVPLITGFVILYLTVYLAAIIPYFVILNLKEYQKTVWAYFIVTSFSFLIFIFFPVKMIRPEFAAQDIFDRLVQCVYLIDLPSNCFPSLHVVYPFLSCFIIWHYHKKGSIFILIWAILISVSVLLIKQHYFLDVVSGILVAVIGYLIFKYRNTY